MSVSSTDSTISPSSSESVDHNIVVWRCGYWMEGVGILAGVRDFLAGAGAEFSSLLRAIAYCVSTAVFASSTAFWDRLTNLLKCRSW